MKIKAAVLAESGKITLQQVEMSDPLPHEVRVRIVATGVCHTDLKCAASTRLVQNRPVVLGHEGAGVVDAVGSAVTQVVPGDHVVMTFASCGTCPCCRDAEPAYCDRQMPINFGCARPDGGVPYLQGEEGPIHGDFFGQSSFATYAIGTERNVIPVRKDVPLELLGPLGCGIQTGAGAALNDLSVGPETSFAVFGTGSVGLSAIMAAHHAGAWPIIAVDRVAARLELARELGASHVIDTSEGEARAQIMSIMPRGVDRVLDTTGVAPLMREAMAILAHRGTFGFVSGTADGSDLGVPMLRMLQGRKVVGIVEGNSNPHLFIPFLTDLFARGRFPFDRLIEFFDFGDIDAAFAAIHDGSVLKPVLRIG